MKNLVRKVKPGNRYGRLIIIDCFLVKKNNQNSKTHCNCVCDCGNNLTTRADALQSGRTQSCGCLQKETTSLTFIRKENKGYNSGSNVLYNNYRAGARYRNLEFNLSREIFQKLTQENCFYCDRVPSSLSRKRKGDSLEKSYIYNGLDRVDPKKGYLENNVVACCQICNYAKSDLTQQEFYDLILKIATKLKGKSSE